jgi:hypothetical protein
MTSAVLLSKGSDVPELALFDLPLAKLVESDRTKVDRWQQL